MPTPDRVQAGQGQDLSSDADAAGNHAEGQAQDDAAPLAPPDDADFSGTPRFQVRRWLGSGGFGAVYEAYDAVRQQPVALKVLKQPQPALLAQFKREFRAVVDLHHPNLVELFELFNEGNQWFFTMDLVEGVNFLQHVHEGVPDGGGAGEFVCDGSRLRDAARQLASAIVAMHEKGIVHRDIKPSNVIVDRSGRVRLLDFGLVKEAIFPNLKTIVRGGTPDYMSPEQRALGSVGAASDWYSFGLVLYHGLFGRLPLRSDASDDSPTELTWPASSGASELSDLVDLCRELLQHDPKLRPSGAEVLKRLGAGIDTAPSPARTVALPAEELLIGRDALLRELRQLANATRSGRAIVANVHGPSGVGKSALLRAFWSQLGREDPEVVILAGRCHESETVPYKALDDLVDGLSRYLSTLRSAELATLSPRDGRSLVRVFPVLAQVEAIDKSTRRGGAVADSQELRDRAFAGLEELLGRLADRKTVVLAIDDLQWGDLDSAAFFSRLLTAATPPSLLFIASYRSEDVETSPFLQSWKASLEGSTAVSVHDLNVTELSAADSAQLADLLLTGRGTRDPHRAHAVAEGSGGSPFLIGLYVDSGPAATSLEAAIAHRLAELTDRERVLLDTLAIAGRPMSFPLVSAATGVDVGDHGSVSRMVTEKLVRIRETRGPRELEVYHDRIRETVVGAMSEARRSERHHALVRALEAVGGADPAVLAMHSREAGDQAAATRYLLAAAESASDALAFDRAAGFYQAVLAQRVHHGEGLVELRRKFARALAYAGRGRDAAQAYLDATPDANAFVGVELRRLAAEQLLRSGHVEEGVELLRTIARNLGIWLPSGPLQLIVSLLWGRVRVAWCGLWPRSQTGHTPSDRDRMLLEVYWSLVTGFMLTGMVRSLDFQNRYFVLAARVGDRAHRAMATIMEAGHRAFWGRQQLRKVGALIAEAHALAAGTAHPQALGLIGVIEAWCALFLGNFQEAWDLSENAENILRENCTGAAWEHGSNMVTGVSAAAQLGEYHLFFLDHRHVPTLLDKAKARGDNYTLQAILCPGSLFFLMTNQAELGERIAREAAKDQPPSRPYSFPDFFESQRRVEKAIYEGRADDAWRLLQETWPVFERSILRRAQYMRIMAYHLRARTALAIASLRPASAADYQREAVSSATQLAKQRAPWGDGLALLVRASVAALDGRKAEAIDLLSRAESQLIAVSMSQYVAAARYRKGLLLGETIDGENLSKALTWAKTERVAEPERIFDMLTPGRWTA